MHNYRTSIVEAVKNNSEASHARALRELCLYLDAKGQQDLQNVIRA